jgi:hypothetical protein
MNNLCELLGVDGAKGQNWSVGIIGSLTTLGLSVAALIVLAVVILLVILGAQFA